MGNAKLPAGREQAAKSYDTDRWRQYVRLSCLDIVNARVVAAGGAYNMGGLVEAAKDLETFVFSG